MDQLSTGQQLENQYRGAGFSDDEINDWKAKRVGQYQQAGFSDKEINDYFGVKETDASAMKAYVQKNLGAFNESRKSADGTPQKEAASFGEAFHAGWENSVSGLLVGGHEADTVLPEHAGFLHRLASNVGQIAGDLPAMVAGGAPGAAMANPIVAGAGAFAAPAAMRKMLMDHYEKGDVHDAGDFAARLASTTWEAIKGGAVGAATSGAGLIAGGGAKGLAAELATMTTAGAALEGRLPQPQEFIDGAAILGGFHLATGGLPSKLRNIYAKTGERPGDIIEAAQNDPVLKQKLLSENPDLPKQAEPDQTELDKALSGPGKESGPKKPMKLPEREDVPEDVKKSTENVLSRLGEKKESIDTQSVSSKFYQQFIDRFDPIKESTDVSGLQLDPEKDPYVLGRNFYGWKDKSASFLTKDGGGTIDFKTGKVNGESLETILNKIKPEEQKDFVAYALSKRALERAGEFKDTGIKKEDAETVVAANSAKFEEHFQNLVSYSDRVMSYAKDAGLISKETYNRIGKGSSDYIPLAREQDLDEFTGQAKGDGAGLYQEMEGSKRKILNPIEQIMSNTMRVVKAADLNRVKSAFGDMVENSENGFAIAERVERASGKDNEISFKRDGETITYKTLPHYAEAIKSLNFDPGKTALWARMLMGPASWLRTGTVLNPDFIMRHGERAMFVSAVQSESGLGGAFKAPVDIAKAMYGNLEAVGNILKNDESYRAFLRSGASQGSIFGIEDYLNKQNVWDLNRETGNFLSKGWNTALSKLQYMAHVSDNLARLAEFKRAGGVSGDVNQTTGAAFRAREVTLDYMRAGAQVKAMSSFVPFMNIGIQGIDRMVRGFKEDKLGFTARAAAALTVPTLLNWAASRNDSRYKDAPNWEKDLYWIIPTNKWEPAANVADAMTRPEDLRRIKQDGTWEVNNGTTLRISKPFELGLLFASVPERLLNRFADHDPRAAGELWMTLLHGAVPNVLPTALTPALEQATNKNFFTGRAIVSSNVEGFLPEYQYNEYTSTVAKQLGHIIGYVPGIRDLGPKDAKLASPQVIDNYIHDWSGTAGQYALQIIDKAERGLGFISRPPPPTSTLADIPFIKAFIVRNPSAQVQPIQDFYDDYDKANKVNSTIRMLMKSGDPTSMQEAMQLSQDNAGDMLKLDPIKKSIGELSKAIQGINESKTISPNDKRQLIDGAYYQMSQIARQGNQIIDARRKAFNAQH